MARDLGVLPRQDLWPPRHSTRAILEPDAGLAAGSLAGTRDLGPRWPGCRPLPAPGSACPASRCPTPTPGPDATDWAVLLEPDDDDTREPRLCLGGEGPAGPSTGGVRRALAGGSGLGVPEEHLPFPGEDGEGGDSLWAQGLGAAPPSGAPHEPPVMGGRPRALRQALRFRAAPGRLSSHVPCSGSWAWPLPPDAGSQAHRKTRVSAPPATFLRSPSRPRPPPPPPNPRGRAGGSSPALPPRLPAFIPGPAAGLVVLQAPAKPRLPSAFPGPRGCSRLRQAGILGDAP